jgi:tRNA (guanine37-N1)-methyltransferase
MHASVVTLFPELFEPFLHQTVLGRAVEAGLIRVDRIELRAFGEGNHRMVDDRPFGGGPGMVLRAEPVVQAIEAAQAGHGPAVRTIIMSPQGRPFDQALAQELADSPDGFILVCGRYEGIDERALDVLQPEEVSLGDFVLSGGEAAAIAMLDATARLVPGVLGHADSSKEDSFSGPDGVLDHPHYTRPAVWRGLAVPEVLLGGNHGAIRAWRRAQALARTAARRPDLLSGEAPDAPVE